MRNTRKTDEDPEMISHEDAAKLLGLRPASLYQWRHRQIPDQPPYYELRKGSIKYRRSEVLQWLAEHRKSFAS